MTDSAIARQAVTEGLATEKELREIAEGWRRWATYPDAWYAVLHGEILCTPTINEMKTHLASLRTRSATPECGSQDDRRHR
jgi:hypothetical protein